MPRFVTFWGGLAETGTKAYAIDKQDRSDGLCDIYLVIDGFCRADLALGVESLEFARKEVQKRLAVEQDVDITQLGTGEQHAPNVIRPDAATSAKLLMMDGVRNG
jgi:hypothetical protein